MKNNLLVLCALGSSHLFAQETPPPLPPKSPLIEIAENSEGHGVIDLTSISFDAYPNTIEYDFERKTSLEKLSEGIDGIWTKEEDLPIDVLQIDGQTFTIEGTSIPESVEHVQLRFGNQELDVDKITVVENYDMILNGQIVASYSSTYFSFFDDMEKLVLEVFHKEKEYYQLAEYYDGISYNIEEHDGEIEADLYMSPNPATTSSDAYFNLPYAGYVVVSLANVDGSVNDIIFAGELASGQNRIPIPARSLKSGQTYTVTVSFANHQFSTNLIIQ